MDTSPLCLWPIQKPVKGSQNAAKKKDLRQSHFGRSNRGLVMAVTQSALQWNQSLHQRGKALVLKWAKQHNFSPVPVIRANPQSKQGQEIKNWSFSSHLFVYKQSYPAFLTIHLLLQLLHREHWNPPQQGHSCPELLRRTISQWQPPLGSWSLPCHCKKRAKQKTECSCHGVSTAELIYKGLIMQIWSPLSSASLVRFGPKMPPVSKRNPESAKTGHMSNPCTVKLGLHVRRDGMIQPFIFESFWANKSFPTFPTLNIEKKDLDKNSGSWITEIPNAASINIYSSPLTTSIHSLECFNGRNAETHVNSSLTSHNLTVWNAKGKRKRRSSYWRPHLLDGVGQCCKGNAQLERGKKL